MSHRAFLGGFGRDGILEVVCIHGVFGVLRGCVHQKRHGDKSFGKVAGLEVVGIRLKKQDLVDELHLIQKGALRKGESSSLPRPWLFGPVRMLTILYLLYYTYPTENDF